MKQYGNQHDSAATKIIWEHIEGGIFSNCWEALIDTGYSAVSPKSCYLVFPGNTVFPVAYWTPTDLGSSSSSVISFCLFILFMEFSRQEYWSGLPFPSPVEHVLSELYTMTCVSWVAQHGMAHSFIELHKAVIHVVLEKTRESLGLQGDPTSPFWRRSALGVLWKEWY